MIKINTMKKLKILFALIALATIIVACNITQQTTAYNTIAAVEVTATTAVNGYYALIIKGVVPTNSVPQVSRAFNDLQLACTLAAATAQAGTNALATANLTTELGDLTTLITSLIPSK